MSHKIIWTEKTWNPFTGCTKCSPGCLNCYAERMVKRLQKITKTADKYSNGFEFTAHTNELTVPFHWKKPRKIFVNSMSDTFHEDAPEWYIREIFKTMNECHWHTFQILTKRPQNITEGLNWTKNINLGVTVCTQEEADKKIPAMINIGAAFSFLSIEPMIEQIDLSKYWICRHGGEYPFKNLEEKHRTKMVDLVDLVIVGGESGPGARPIHPDWVRSVRDQCADAGVPFLFKQWGEWCPSESVPDEKRYPAATYCGGEWSKSSDDWVTECDCGPMMYRVGKKMSGRTLDGMIHDGKYT